MAEVQKPSQAGAKSKKARKKKPSKDKSNGDATALNEAGNRAGDDEDREEYITENSEPLDPPTPLQTRNILGNVDEGHGLSNTSDLSCREAVPEPSVSAGRAAATRVYVPDPVSSISPSKELEIVGGRDAELRLESAMRERDHLLVEVANIRRSLEQLQERCDVEMNEARENLLHTQADKEHAETQYQTLLGKVNTIRTQLGERLKADAEDLSQARNKIEELERENTSLKTENEAHATELTSFAENAETQSRELSSLRNRATLSQQNWIKERDDFLQREIFAKEEFEAAKQAMQDWEILAMEERSVRENIAGRVAELEEQAANHRENYQQAASERDSQSTTIDGLQRVLQELQDERRRELRATVESYQAQCEGLNKTLHEMESRAREISSELSVAKQELQRVSPFEREVREKNLMIGKLRHEAVILNDHLTKALKYLKKGKQEDTIDKQLVTNHLLHFLALERSDPKKFQVLQVMAGILAWSEEQREQAGLARPGASNSNFRMPASPWLRTPSTPALNTDFSQDGTSRKDSLAELWSGFLAQETSEDGNTPKSIPSSSGQSKC